MEKRLRQVTAAALVASLMIACPGLAPYQALAGGVEGRAAESVQLEPSNAAPAAPSVGQFPGQGIFEAGALSGLQAAPGLQIGAAESSALDAAVQAKGKAEGEPARESATPGSGPGTIEASEGGGTGRAASAPNEDLDHADALRTASLGVDAAGNKVSGAASDLAQAAKHGETAQTRPGVPGRRFYVYETERDYKISNPAKAIHFGSIGVKMAIKLWLFAKISKMVAIVAGAAFVVIPPKLMAFLRLYSGIHLTLASPAIARHAPIFSDRREVLQPHEELGQIPGVLRTIDINERHDSAEGFSYFGSFLNRRVEKHQTLVMTDVSLPAEIRAQDGGLLGRLREIDAKDTLVLRGRTRLGNEVAVWRRSVERFFSGDAMDAATAAQVRAGLDDQFVRSMTMKLLKLALVSVAIGLGLYFLLEHFLIPGADHYAELAGLIYFIVAGVFDHSGGPRIFRKHFFLAEKPQASLWTRTKQFLKEAWNESKEHHAHAITVARETSTGEEHLGDIARGLGAHAFAGNGLRRQLGMNSPYILGLLAVGTASLHSTAALATAAWPLAVAAALAAAVVPAYKFLVPLATSRTKPGLTIHKHDGDNRLTTLLVAGFGLIALAAALAVTGHLWAAFSAVGLLAAVAVVLDPFSSKGAAAYEARRHTWSIPWLRGAFVLGSMVAASAFLPAASVVMGEILVAGSAVLLTSLFADVKHLFNPRIDDVRTPRSTPALASQDLSR